MSTQPLYFSIPDHNPTVAAEEEIRQIEWAWGAAYERADMDFIEQILAEEYVFTDPFGNVSTRNQSLAAVENRDVVFDSTHSDNVRISIIGDTAVVTARSNFKGRYKGWSIGGSYQYTDVFVKRGGSWVAVVSHVTVIKGGTLRLRIGRFIVDRLQPWFAHLNIL